MTTLFPNQTRPLGRRHRAAAGGYILLFALIALLAVAALIPLFAKSIFARTRTSVKTQRQDLAAAELEARYADFRNELRNLLTSGASLAYAGNGTSLLQSAFRSSANSQFTLETTLTAARGASGDEARGLENRPPLWPGGALRSYAGMPDPELELGEMPEDPFYGAPADVFPVTLDAILTPRQAPASPSDPVTLEGQLRLAFRLIPASAFTLASWNDAVVDDSCSSDAGRIYARRTVRISASSSRVPWKIAAGAGVTVETGASLAVSATPNEQQLSLPAGSSTAGEDWMQTRLRWASGAVPIATGREAPAALILPLPLSGMLAPRDPDVPSPPAGSLELLKFEHHADLVVRENEGALWMDGPAKAVAAAHIAYYQTNRHQESRIIGVDVTAFVQACLDAGMPARLVIRSTTPTTVVLLRSAESLPGPFSLATPQPVLVAGEFNANGHPASIITSARLRSVIAEF